MSTLQEMIEQLVTLRSEAAVWATLRDVFSGALEAAESDSRSVDVLGIQCSADVVMSIFAKVDKIMDEVSAKADEMEGWEFGDEDEDVDDGEEDPEDPEDEE